MGAKTDCLCSLVHHSRFGDNYIFIVNGAVPSICDEGNNFHEHWEAVVINMHCCVNKHLFCPTIYAATLAKNIQNT